MKEENGMMFFENKEFGPVRAVEKDGETWFVAKDVCNCLELKNSKSAVIQLKDKLESVGIKGVVSNYPLLTTGGQQDMTIINEQMLYELVFVSRKKKAVSFRAWVTGVILPDIRKTGQYKLSETVDSYQIDDPVKRAERWIEEYNEKKQIETKYQSTKPYLKYCKAVVDNNLSMDIDTYAKLISDENFIIGQNNLFKWLRNNHYIKQNSRTPYQRWIDEGYFELSSYNNSAFSPKTLITAKGQVKLAAKIRVNQTESAVDLFLIA